jgi:hypothetical protein
MKLKKFLTLAAAAGSMVLASTAIAAPSVAWLAPPNNSAFPAGSIQAPVGQASAGVVGGTGLDLALVVDTSGSMGGSGITAAKTAAVALVDALPQNTTSVTVIRFNSSAQTVQVLTALNPSKASVIAAINGLTTGGNTTIGSGIDQAVSELNGPLATAGRSKQMVVLSDGFSSGTPQNNAAAAVVAGIDSVHSVGIPGHNVAQMQAIATSGNGVYTAGDLTTLTGIFDGTGGNLVGIDHVDLIEPDGTVHPNYPIDGLGNFTAPGYALAAGPNTWTATAYDSTGASASAQLTLIGTTVNQTPDGGSSLVLLGLGLAGLFVARRK